VSSLPPPHLRTETDPVSETKCLYSREYRTMGKVLKPSNSVCYTPSSEPFRIYSFRVHKGFADDYITSKMNSLTITFHFSKIRSNVVLSSTPRYPVQNLYGFIISLMHGTCPFYILFPDLRATMICGFVHNYEIPHYAVSARLILFPLTYVKIFATQLTRSEILIKVNIKITVLQDVTPCSLVYR
jgi:hypothetical protein